MERHEPSMYFNGNVLIYGREHLPFSKHRFKEIASVLDEYDMSDLVIVFTDVEQIENGFPYEMKEMGKKEWEDTVRELGFVPNGVTLSGLRCEACEFRDKCKQPHKDRKFIAVVTDKPHSNNDDADMVVIAISMLFTLFHEVGHYLDLKFWHTSENICEMEKDADYFAYTIISKIIPEVEEELKDYIAERETLYEDMGWCKRKTQEAIK